MNLVRSDLPTDLSMMLLGYDLPPDWTYEMVADAVRENIEMRSELRVPSRNFNTDLGPNTPPSSQRSAQSIALDTYKSHAIKRFKNGKSIKGTKDAPKFESADIPNTLKAAVGGALNRAKKIEDINRIFEDAKKSEHMHNIDWSDYP